MISSTSRAHLLSLATACLIGLAASAPARAESIPTQYLDKDQASCIAACNGGKLLSPESCTTYCSCEVQTIGEQFTLDEYKAMSDAVGQNQAPQKATLDKMKTIANTCKAGLK